ncbi:MAG: hypothetical protein K8F52_10470 [Candidatus Scalindua rubra]|uniref:Uncharacterized protein n=1 Tax=Candidatus Scalindua brodae TaxID=237368 RepID=A0A0B0EJR6_9BACT|nr:MAG: hypothetical protein SCABRO_03236 [Candidatus Scalindua brodae]MBZ0109083.1 hypothetical protein [Candidatus Scalindua rubra]TWU33516.1 hypothetical protein S225a_14050 [Candidatus Brocadiaceae bacterium S225]
MSDIKENIVNSIKTLILPELSKLQEGINEIRIRQESLEKQMVMINENVLGNSRRIDDTNRRIDLIYVEIGDIKKEMERLKREDAVTADILHRMAVLEEKVLLKQ